MKQLLFLAISLISLAPLAAEIISETDPVVESSFFYYDTPKNDLAIYKTAKGNIIFSLCSKSGAQRPTVEICDEERRTLSVDIHSLFAIPPERERISFFNIGRYDPESRELIHQSGDQLEIKGFGSAVIEIKIHYASTDAKTQSESSFIVMEENRPILTLDSISQLESFSNFLVQGVRKKTDLFLKILNPLNGSLRVHLCELEKSDPSLSSTFAKKTSFCSPVGSPSLGITEEEFLPTQSEPLRSFAISDGSGRFLILNSPKESLVELFICPNAQIEESCLKLEDYRKGFLPSEILLRSLFPDSMTISSRSTPGYYLKRPKGGQGKGGLQLCHHWQVNWRRFVGSRCLELIEVKGPAELTSNQQVLFRVTSFLNRYVKIGYSTAQAPKIETVEMLHCQDSQKECVVLQRSAPIPKTQLESKAPRRIDLQPVDRHREYVYFRRDSELGILKFFFCNEVSGRSFPALSLCEPLSSQTGYDFQQLSNLPRITGSQALTTAGLGILRLFLYERTLHWLGKQIMLKAMNPGFWFYTSSFFYITTLYYAIRYLKPFHDAITDRLALYSLSRLLVKTQLNRNPPNPNPSSTIEKQVWYTPLELKHYYARALKKIPDSIGNYY